VGDGGGVWSFLHLDDAATATVAAIEHSGSGVYNVVDDEPAPVAVWLSYRAEVVGAKPPVLAHNTEGTAAPEVRVHTNRCPSRLAHRRRRRLGPVQGRLQSHRGG